MRQAFSSLLAAAALSMQAFSPAPVLRPYSPTRSRRPGKVAVSGNKLARKAARGQIGIIHGGLSPKMPARFPFSAKRR